MIGTERITAYRPSEAGEYDSHGNWVPANVGEITIVGSVQPMKGREIQILPEGARGAASYWLYSDRSLNTVDLSAQTAPDRVSWHGRLYEVHAVGDWTGHQAGLAHYVYALTEVGIDEIPIEEGEEDD